MGTKNDPGKFDCYANAEPDEPLFVLPVAEARACAEAMKLWAVGKGKDVGPSIAALAAIMTSAS